MRTWAQVADVPGYRIDAGQSVLFSWLRHFLLFPNPWRVSVLTPSDRGLLCLFSGVGAYLGEGVPWGTLRLQLESDPEPISVTACSWLSSGAWFAPQGGISLPRPTGLWRGGAGCRLLRVYF